MKNTENIYLVQHTVVLHYDYFVKAPTKAEAIEKANKISIKNSLNNYVVTNDNFDVYTTE